MKKVEKIAVVVKICRNGLLLSGLYLLPMGRSYDQFIGTGIDIEDFRIAPKVMLVDKSKGIAYLDLSIYHNEEDDMIYISDDSERFGICSYDKLIEIVPQIFEDK